jgi:AcrR family transcriptional regulator
MESATTSSLSDRFWTAPRPSQQDRYEKVLRATIDLAREGGYEAVQVRAVAKRSGVAIGTVYTYFQSRDNLAYRAMVAWQTRLAENAASVSDSAALPGPDGLEADVVRLTNNFRAEPGLLDAFIRSTLSNDPIVVAQRRELDFAWWTNLRPSLAWLGPETAELAPRLLTDVFYASAVRWAFGQIEFSEILTQMLAVVHLMVRAAPDQAS